MNPCPLKACCSNWGFCGVFPGHCDVHAPEGGGPGTKEIGFQNTCVSNCGSEIKTNSVPLKPHIHQALPPTNDHIYRTHRQLLVESDTMNHGTLTEIAYGSERKTPIRMALTHTCIGVLLKSIQSLSRLSSRTTTISGQISKPYQT